MNIQSTLISNKTKKLKLIKTQILMLGANMRVYSKY